MNLTLGLTDFAALSPLLILLGAALIILLWESFFPTHTAKYVFPFTIAILLIALYAAVVAPISNNPLLTPWLKFDSYSRFFAIFFLLIGLASAFLASSFFTRSITSQGEYYFLLLSCLFGLILIGASADFLTLFLGLETLSISLYILCGYMKQWDISREASLKYFLMGALAAAILLYGIALIYGAIGTTNFEQLLSGYRAISNTQNHTLFLAGISLVTIGFAFKAAIVPFHVWAPDVYDGAPNPVTAFMAVGTKVGAFAAFGRVFLLALPQFNVLWNESIAFLAIPTLLYANFVALRQNQLRRFFAYSGISHAGFLLLPLAAGTPDALSSLLFYLVVYAFATLACFAVIAFLDKDENGVMMNDLNGLFRRSPLLASILSLGLLTLAGIPPTAGFLAKLMIFKVALEAHYYALVIVAVLTTILSAYYYLRIIGYMLAKEPAEKQIPNTQWAAGTIALVTVIVVIGLSLYPAPLLALFQRSLP